MYFTMCVHVPLVHPRSLCDSLLQIDSICYHLVLDCTYFCHFVKTSAASFLEGDSYKYQEYYLTLIFLTTNITYHLCVLSLFVLCHVHKLCPPFRRIILSTPSSAFAIFAQISDLPRSARILVSGDTKIGIPLHASAIGTIAF